jgi:hypothetical protein
MSPTPTITRDSWKQILASAVSILDDLQQRQPGSPDVVMGGGTVLMFRFEHRLSKDIDFFMHDVQWLSMLTPRLNDTTAAMVTRYVEQANGLKLAMSHGDIDFVVAGPVTDAKAVESLEFLGRTFRLEATEEILAKKLFYRAARFQPRDVFDLVVVAEADPEAAVRAVAAAASERDILVRRLEQLSQLPLERRGEGILPIGGYSRIVPTMIEAGSRFLGTRCPIEARKHNRHLIDAMTKSFDPVAIPISAIENVSLIPVTREDIKTMLRTGTGEPAHIMALFSDVDYSVLLRLAIIFDISDAELAQAYVRARDLYAASNAELDEFVAEREMCSSAHPIRSPSS